METSTPNSSSTVVEKTKEFVKAYMGKYDGSHDYAHILRVLAMAEHILELEQKEHPAVLYDSTTVTLAALMHDVGDHKYIALSRAGTKLEDPSTIVKSTLISLGASPEQADCVQAITKSVSYSHEIANRDYVQGVLLQHPELAIVQDADRLDALGAVGIGRTFTYGGAKGTEHGMLSTIQHFEDKLNKLEGLMKTGEGKRLAKVRTERLKVFKDWWEDENNFVELQE
ncbi:hypothetical protein MMC14_007220 [Varicellaria rhodocarpa]|nr:hypothetical protein [Varicellaria rhodocarpa]